MSKKNLKIILFVILGIILVILGVFMFNIFTKGESATKTFNTYKNNWVKQDYKSMYNLLSSETKKTVTQKQFVDKYTAIYSGIEAKNISIKVENEDQIKEGNKKNINIPFSIDMDTTAGKLTMPGYKASMVKEKIDNKKQWTIVWDEKMIFPSMETGDKVRITPDLAVRGEIIDRDGKGLAINGTMNTVGIHPSRFNANKETNISEMAKILDIDVSLIEDKLKANSNPEQLVPIVNILSSETAKKDGLDKLIGVNVVPTTGRVYPGGEAFGALIGYIRPITAEELKKNANKGYSSVSLIGAKGLEQVNEDRLKGENGATIYISKVKDDSKVVILKKESKAGENIKLSVNTDLQKKIYEGMKKEPGASAAINPKTGEVLALVSSPSFDSNAYTTYKSNAQLLAWKNESAKEPFKNRFSAAYSPGSTFKLITAAIGLDNGKIKPDELVGITGKKWQLDGSWGPHMVTRVNDKVSSVNLNSAFVYSDNIYFAKSAINIGAEEFIKGSNKFGIGEKLPIGYPIANSQIANGNKIKNDSALADTGYGQGEVLMSPLQLALSYSAVVNDGTIMSPTLEFFNEKVTSKVWKESVISKDNINIIKNDLTAVIEDPNGTAHDVKIDGVALAGKTGTAELKKDDSDTTGKENGWFVCMDTANPKIVVSMLIEDVKDKHGSHFVTPMVKGVMDYYMHSEVK
ncbi:penicillin-binding transpeptidase domain-containing protein [Clostridium lacusfryxellense]|uniref:penicillin-binding transpeptidase domain-containing protein n=1 Tax=Clostridium lacusfryxellense TaxID=205328 RepID=UPI001C0C82FF|nr:penicillin-binding transpeptidase domain-containing protein [Clostridium lacusfryxellense]MBU3111128.1 penicillin-binding transpeptidase domain-containing protein [Clostridium lacusfryxellense]